MTLWYNSLRSPSHLRPNLGVLILKCDFSFFFPFFFFFVYTYPLSHTTVHNSPSHLCRLPCKFASYASTIHLFLAVPSLPSPARVGCALVVVWSSFNVARLLQLQFCDCSIILLFLFCFQYYSCFHSSSYKRAGDCMWGRPILHPRVQDKEPSGTRFVVVDHLPSRDKIGDPHARRFHPSKAKTTCKWITDFTASPCLFDTRWKADHAEANQTSLTCS